MDQIRQHRKHDADLQQRLRDALADETADRLDFGDDHRNRDPLRFDCGGGRAGRLDKGVKPPTPDALGPLPDAAAIDVERELGPSLDEHAAGIDRAQADHPGIGRCLTRSLTIRRCNSSGTTSSKKTLTVSASNKSWWKPLVPST